MQLESEQSLNRVGSLFALLCQGRGLGSITYSMQSTAQARSLWQALADVLVIYHPGWPHASRTTSSGALSRHDFGGVLNSHGSSSRGLSEAACSSRETPEGTPRFGSFASSDHSGSLGLRPAIDRQLELQLTAK